MIIVWGSIETTAENLDRVLELSLEHVRRSRTEPGCLKHGVHIDAEHGTRLVFYEEWQDLPALQAHFQVPESQQFVAQVAGLATAPPELKYFESRPVEA